MGVCVVENLSRVFLFEWPHIYLWVMMVYIVWVKDKKVTFKNPPGREFHGYLARHSQKQHPSVNFQLLACVSHIALLLVSFS